VQAAESEEGLQLTGWEAAGLLFSGEGGGRGGGKEDNQNATDAVVVDAS